MQSFGDFILAFFKYHKRFCKHAGSFSFLFIFICNIVKSSTNLEENWNEICGLSCYGKIPKAWYLETAYFDLPSHLLVWEKSINIQKRLTSWNLYYSQRTKITNVNELHFSCRTAEHPGRRRWRQLMKIGVHTWMSMGRCTYASAGKPILAYAHH